MASTPSFFHNFTPFPAINPSTNKRSSSLQAFSSSLSLPTNIDYLKKEFCGHGVSFEGIGDSCAVKMRLENGSVASLVLPSGLITSYKPFMWHGTTMEVVHTLVSEREDGEVFVEGGVSMDLSCVGEMKWGILDVRGSSEQSIQA